MAQCCKWHSVADGIVLQMAQRCRWHSLADDTALQMVQRCIWHSVVGGITLQMVYNIIQCQLRLSRIIRSGMTIEIPKAAHTNTLTHTLTHTPTHTHARARTQHIHRLTQQLSTVHSVKHVVACPTLYSPGSACQGTGACKITKHIIRLNQYFWLKITR